MVATPQYSGVVTMVVWPPLFSKYTTSKTCALNFARSLQTAVQLIIIKPFDWKVVIGVSKGKFLMWVEYIKV
jgi:hypothetical protein